MVYGLSSDSRLDILIGREVVQVAVGRFQTLIHFDNGVTLTLEGACEVDAKRRGPGIDAGSELLSLIGRIIESARPVDARHLEIRFDGGRVLMLVEDSEEFESFSITGPSVTIVV